MMTIEHFDATVRSWMLAHQNDAASGLLRVVTNVGAPNPMAFVALSAAGVLWWRRRAAAALSVLLAPAAAMATYEIGKRFIARARPPGTGAIIEDGYAFPSAHATTSAAVCATLALVLWQERLVPAPIALAIGILAPLLVGLSRVYFDVHWATDVLGGWSAGGVIAIGAAALNRSLRTVR